MLGKRKRAAGSATAAAEPSAQKQESLRKADAASVTEDMDAQALFKKHFEERFLPIALPSMKHGRGGVQQTEEEEEEENAESEWAGIEDGDGDEDEEDAVVENIEVVRLAKLDTQGVMSREELKLFMRSRPPTLLSATTTETHRKSTKGGDGDDADDAKSEAAHLKKDLALQRLLAESHLLEPSGHNSSTLAGRNRHIATDMRVQSLGSKTSILTQEKMPMAHRKGMLAKQQMREERRRREARENGIVLERRTSSTKARTQGRRDPGVGAPAVGKFAGGTLTLSKRDIVDIEGPRRSGAGMGRGGGRGRGRGGKSAGGRRRGHG